MKTKKVLENNSDNSCDISDVSSCDISGNESDTGLTIVANEEKPMKNKKKVTTEELRKVIEKSLASSDDEKPIKNKKKVFTKKSKKVVENSDSSTSSGDDKDHKKPTKPIKNKKKLNTKDAPKKTLVEGDDFKKRQRKAKKLGAKTLDCSKRKKIISFTKVKKEETSIWQKRRKSQTKMVISLMILHHFQIIGQ